MDSSFVEITIGTQETITGDWSFIMFLYIMEPHRGTIFDFVYDSLPPHPTLYSSKIKLELNGSLIVFTMQGPSKADYGSATLTTIFTSHVWIPLAVVHDKSSGDITLMTLDNAFYHSQNNRKNVFLPQPAKIKLGGSYDTPSSFEGSIVCFAVYDTKVSASSFDQALTECNPSNWLVTPNTVGKWIYWYMTL